MLLQDFETCRQARLIHRELIKGDKYCRLYLHADRSYSSPNIARHARNNIANPWQITVIWRSLNRFSKFIYSFLSIP